MREPDSDPRMEFVYTEAVRGLIQQQSLVESMNTRTGSLIFAAAFANSLLGNRALGDGLGAFEWLAVTTLFAIGGLIVFMVWPYHRYKFRFAPGMLLAQYVEGDAPMSLAAMHRALALRIEADMADNWVIVQRLRVTLQIALVVLLVNIATWMFAIAWA
jgi:hypothetical protein